MNYDLDYFSVFPDEIFSDPKTGGMLKEMGMSFGHTGNKVPLFRDPKTAEALKKAPEPIQQFIANIGVGSNHYSSGAPAGYHLDTDEPHRAVVADKLMALAMAPETQKVFAIRPKRGGFNLQEFLKCQAESKPITAQDIAKGKFKNSPTDKKRLQKAIVLIAIIIFLVYLNER